MLSLVPSAAPYGPNSIVNGQSASNKNSRSYFGFKYASSNDHEMGTMFLLSTDTTGLRAVTATKFLQILTLTTKRLLAPLSVLVEQDGDEYIAQTVDLPLYGSADTAHEAIEILKSEIESLYNDLMEDDNFSDEWLTRKKLLRAVVAN